MNTSAVLGYVQVYRCIISYRIVLFFRLESFHIILYHFISYCTISHRIVLFQVILYHFIRLVSFHIVLY